MATPSFDVVTVKLRADQATRSLRVRLQEAQPIRKKMAAPEAELAEVADKVREAAKRDRLGVLQLPEGSGRETLAWLATSASWDHVTRVAAFRVRPRAVGSGSAGSFANGRMSIIALRHGFRSPVLRQVHHGICCPQFYRNHPCNQSTSGFS